MLRRFGIPILVALIVSGCTLTPTGTREERDKAAEVGKAFERPVEKRAVPPLPVDYTWRDLLRHAFLSNGELESRYFEWKAALAKIDQASAWPNSNVSLGYSYLFSDENLKSFDRQTFSVGFDPSQNLSFPTKVAQAGKVALDNAREAGERFRAAKFDLQKRVLSAFLQYSLQAEKIRIARRNLDLLELVVNTATSRVQSGGQQQDLLKAQIEYRRAEDALKRMEAERLSTRAELNALIGRPAEAELVAPKSLVEARAIGATDAQLIAMATDRNPELGALARQVQGRKDALELARQQYIPDISPAAMFTGNLSQSVGAAIMLPTTFPQINAAIEENRAMLRSTQAMARQTTLDRSSAFVAGLYALRDNERQAEFLKSNLLPAAEQLLSASRQSYSAGMIGFAELIDSQRTVLDVRLMYAEARAGRETRLAEIEALAGTDVETLGERGRVSGEVTRPSPRPSPGVPGEGEREETSTGVLGAGEKTASTTKEVTR